MKSEDVPRALLLLLVLGLSAVVILTLGVGCGDEENPQAPNLKTCALDTIPPAAVTDLILKSPTINSIVPVWTAPGDDGSKGTAAKYDIRYSISPITEESWDSATGVDEAPEPKPAGQLQSVYVLGLEPGTVYHFAIKTLDDVSNESSLSNDATGATVQESVPPSAVRDLVAVAVSATSFQLTWTAPGDDGMTGTAREYDIRYSTRPITDENWSSRPQVDGVPPPKAGGEIETFDINGLEPGTNYLFAMKTVDDVPIWSDISNVAPGLEYNSFIWAYPDTIHEGEYAKIVYKASGGEPLTLCFSNDRFQECGGHPLKTLAEGTFPTGIYSVTCDFYDNATRDYYPAYFPFYIRLCWGLELKGKVAVRLRD